MCKDGYKNKLWVEWEAIAHHFLITEVEQRVDTMEDSEEDQLSSSGDSEENESSSVETKSDGELIERVYYLVCIQW